jgi:hypothetical protein
VFDVQCREVFVTAAEAIRLSARRGLHFDVDEKGIVILSNRSTINELNEILEQNRSEICSLLGEHLIMAKSGDPVSGAALLHYGLWPPTKPHDCKFYIGDPKQHCRRCGATWQRHLELQGYDRTEPGYSRWIASNARTDDTLVPEGE